MCTKSHSTAHFVYPLRLHFYTFMFLSLSSPFATIHYSAAHFFNYAYLWVSVVVRFVPIVVSVFMKSALSFLVSPVSSEGRRVAVRSGTPLHICYGHRSAKVNATVCHVSSLPAVAGVRFHLFLKKNRFLT